MAPAEWNLGSACELKESGASRLWQRPRANGRHGRELAAYCRELAAHCRELAVHALAASLRHRGTRSCRELAADCRELAAHALAASLRQTAASSRHTRSCRELAAQLLAASSRHIATSSGHTAASSRHTCATCSNFLHFSRPFFFGTTIAPHSSVLSLDKVEE